MINFISLIGFYKSMLSIKAVGKFEDKVADLEKENQQLKDDKKRLEFNLEEILLRPGMELALAAEEHYYSLATKG